MSMTNKEVVRVLGNLKFFHDDDNEIYEACNMAIEALKEQRPHGEWIPCSERLPQKSGYYVVTTDGSRNHVIDIAEYGRLWDKRCEDFGWGWNKASRVIAWMPLPKPYKAESEEVE